MPEKEPKGDDEGGGVATAPPLTKEKKKNKPPQPKKRPPGLLPQWKVLLHNDDKNSIEFVVVTVMELCALPQQAAIMRTLEAHKTGVALLLITHKERAELYKEQFMSKGLTVTIEPAD
jgi:ATP-dependent Clp protease adaptor protein ClpS